MTQEAHTNSFLRLTLPPLEATEEGQVAFSKQVFSQAGSKDSFVQLNPPLWKYSAAKRKEKEHAYVTLSFELSQASFTHI